jgi:hypothetical protein
MVICLENGFPDTAGHPATTRHRRSHSTLVANVSARTTALSYPTFKGSIFTPVNSKRFATGGRIAGGHQAETRIPMKVTCQTEPYRAASVSSRGESGVPINEQPRAGTWTFKDNVNRCGDRKPVS